MSTLSYPRHHRRELALPARIALASTLSLAIAALAGAVSAVGLFADLYRDNAWVKADQQGNDVVTLVVVAALIAALVFAQRGSLRARLVWLGVLAYMLYNFCFYLFGLAFNDAFLAYAALVALSIWALVLGLRDLDVDDVAAAFGSRVPVRGVSAYMLVLALGLAGAWVAQSLAFALNGTVPTILKNTGNPTSIVFALDLTLVVPALVVAAILLWRRRPWGYLLATIQVIKSVGYATALLAMSAFQAHHQIKDAWSFAPFAVVFLVGGVACSFLLIRAVTESSSARGAQR